jgi:hypothetical protein
MKTPRKLETIAAGLTVPERVLLFCVASSTSWQKAGVTGETLTTMGKRGSSNAMRRGAYRSPPRVAPRYGRC